MHHETVGRFGRRSLSAAVTAGVIALVILANILLSFLLSATRGYTDMTSEEMYTLTEQARRLLATTLDQVNDSRPEKGFNPQFNS